MSTHKFRRGVPKVVHLRYSIAPSGKFGGTGNALKAGLRPSVLATVPPGPLACGPRAVSTRGWNLVPGATQTQTAGSIP